MSFGTRAMEAIVDKLMEERRERTEQEQDHIDRPRTAQGAFMRAIGRVVDELPLGNIGAAKELLKWTLEDSALLCEVQGEVGDKARSEARKFCAALHRELKAAVRLDRESGELVPVTMQDVVA